MSERAVVVEIHFNSIAFSDNIYSLEWIKYRMDITMRYTVPSLANQTDKRFSAFLYYMDGTEPLIREALQPYGPLPAHIQFIPISLRDEKVNEAIRGSQTAYVARIDSDNMFVKTYIERLRACKPNPATEVLVTRQGYLYDCATNRMATVTYKSPSFFTFIYRTEDYIAGNRYAVKTHNDAIKYKYELIGGRNFVVTIHGSNELLRFKVRASELIAQSKVEALLNQFR
jgi:hypothetical protein